MSIVQIVLFCDLHVNGPASIIEIRSSSKPRVARCRAGFCRVYFSFSFFFLQFPATVACSSFCGPKSTSLTLKLNHRLTVNRLNNKFSLSPSQTGLFKFESRPVQNKTRAIQRRFNKDSSQLSMDLNPSVNRFKPLLGGVNIRLCRIKTLYAEWRPIFGETLSSDIVSFFFIRGETEVNEAIQETIHLSPANQGYLESWHVRFILKPYRDLIKFKSLL